MSTAQIVDLSLPIESGMPHFEGTPPVRVTRSHELDAAGYRMCTLSLGNHAGTHLDAPSHFLADGTTVDQLGLDRCMGAATVLDLTGKRPLEPITVADLVAAGATSLDGRRLLLRTDWDLHFGGDDYFLDYPPLAPETADWLAEGNVWLVGLDIPSLHQTEFARMHEVMLGAGIVIVESLANLSQLRAPTVGFAALPLKLIGADGAPVRAVGYDLELAGAA